MVGITPNPLIVFSLYHFVCHLNKGYHSECDMSIQLIQIGNKFFVKTLEIKMLKSLLFIGAFIISLFSQLLTTLTSTF